MNNKQGVADNIKNRLKELGINNSKFANMIGVAPSTVTQWLSGNHNFTIKTNLF